MSKAIRKQLDQLSAQVHKKSSPHWLRLCFDPTVGIQPQNETGAPQQLRAAFFLAIFSVPRGFRDQLTSSPLCVEILSSITELKQDELVDRIKTALLLFLRSATAIRTPDVFVGRQFESESARAKVDSVSEVCSEVLLEPIHPSAIGAEPVVVQFRPVFLYSQKNSYLADAVLAAVTSLTAHEQMAVRRNMESLEVPFIRFRLTAPHQPPERAAHKESSSLFAKALRQFILDPVATALNGVPLQGKRSAFNVDFQSLALIEVPTRPNHLPQGGTDPAPANARTGKRFRPTRGPSQFFGIIESLVAKSRRRSYVTWEEINEGVPDDLAMPGNIENIIASCEALGIDIRDASDLQLPVPNDVAEIQLLLECCGKVGCVFRIKEERTHLPNLGRDQVIDVLVEDILLDLLEQVRLFSPLLDSGNTDRLADLDNRIIDQIANYFLPSPFRRDRLVGGTRPWHTIKLGLHWDSQPDDATIKAEITTALSQFYEIQENDSSYNSKQSSTNQACLELILRTPSESCDPAQVRNLLKRDTAPIGRTHAAESDLATADLSLRSSEEPAYLTRLRAIAKELIDVAPAPKHVSALQEIIAAAQQQPPQSKPEKTRFVNLVNMVLEATSHRIELPDKKLTRLCIKPGRTGDGYIQFSPTVGGSGGRFMEHRNLRLVPFTHRLTNRVHK